MLGIMEAMRKWYMSATNVEGLILTIPLKEGMNFNEASMLPRLSGGLLYCMMLMRNIILKSMKTLNPVSAGHRATFTRSA